MAEWYDMESRRVGTTNRRKFLTAVQSLGGTSGG